MRLPLPAPSGMRVGPYVDGAAPQPVGGRGGFFDSYHPVWNGELGWGYVPALPQPLFTVAPTAGGKYQLGDGSIVSGSEVEKIYAEQRRRMRGEDEPEPPALIRGSVNRLRNGQIPLANQLTAGGAEADPSCHPDGGWELDPGYRYYPERTQRYENQVTRAPGVDYVVR